MPTASTQPPRSAFAWFLTSASLWMAGMSLQGFLFTWLLVGSLAEPAERVGLARSLAELPPLLMLLLGGVLGDRADGRRVLALMHVLMALPPLMIAAIYLGAELTFGWIVVFGVLMAGLQALSDPARQSALSRVSRLDVQRSVTIMTIFTSSVGLIGFYLGGRLESLGLPTVLCVQAAIFALGLGSTLRLPPLPVRASGAPALGRGIRIIMRLPLIRNVIGLNLISSLFNAGAYIVAIPFVVREIYHGDASFFATVMIVFTAGSIGSNVLLLAFMPLVRPGRLFLVMQLSRAAILLLLWLEPAVWLFYLGLFAWGLNMGVTTTIVRTTVQELAPEAVRAQILAVLLLSFLVSSPVSSLLLGGLISQTSAPAALLPGVLVSALVFVLGFQRSGLWQYRYSGEPLALPEPARSSPAM